MKTKLRKWDDDLALKIPKRYAAEMRLEEGSAVNVSFENGQMIVKSASKQNWTLQGLLAGVTEQNIHHEIDFGFPKGHEVW